MEDQHFDTRRAPRLDSEERLEELRLDELLKDVAGVRPGMTCVDLGCGTGTFSVVMAEHAGPGGMVYAVDDSAEMLDHLRARRPPGNLKTVHADAGATGLESGIADYCLMAFILHEVRQPERLAAEALRLLKAGGGAMVVEWRSELESPGPPQRIRLSEARMTALLTEAGFVDFSYAVWSGNHYRAMCRKPAAG